MNKTKLFSTTLAAGLLALGTVFQPSQAKAENVPQVVMVLRVKGEARYSSDNHTWLPLRQGDILKSGCVIQTAPKSAVDLELGDRERGLVPVSYGGAGGAGAPPSTQNAMYTPEQAGVNIIRVFENSALSVDKLTKDRMSSGDEVSDTQLDLKAGQIFGNVKKLSKDSKYEVKIPNGVAGIRGTTYLIGDGKIFVLTGSVVVAVVHPDGTVTTTTVHAGESFDIDTGKIEPLTKRERQRLEELSRILPQGPNNPGYIPGQPIIFVTPYGGKHP